MWDPPSGGLSRLKPAPTGCKIASDTQVVGVKPRIEYDERPQSRPRHVLAVAEERLPQTLNGRGLHQPSAGQAVVTQPPFAERAERAAHPWIERQRKALLGAMHDALGQESVQRFNEQRLGRVAAWLLERVRERSHQIDEVMIEQRHADLQCV